MSDLIDRKTVFDVIDKCILEKLEGDTVEIKEPLKLITKIYRIPSAQPQRKKGRWIWWYEEAVTEHATEYTQHCKCSECGRECAPSVATYSNFCRNCGADMRGESDE